MKTALILVSLSFSLPILADQKIEARKKNALSHIDAQIEELKKGKECINQAASAADLKNCRSKMKQNIKALNRKRTKVVDKKAKPEKPVKPVKPVTDNKEQMPAEEEN